MEGLTLGPTDGRPRGRAKNMAVGLYIPHYLETHPDTADMTGGEIGPRGSAFEWMEIYI